MIPQLMMGASLGTQLAGSVMNYFGRQEQVRRMRAEAGEQDRRRRLRNKMILGEGEAAAGASGFTSDSGSLRNYLDQMALEMRRQSDWALKSDLLQANDLDRASKFSLVGDFGGALFSYGSANNWWRG